MTHNVTMQVQDLCDEIENLQIETNYLIMAANEIGLFGVAKKLEIISSLQSGIKTKITSLKNNMHENVLEDIRAGEKAMADTMHAFLKSSYKNLSTHESVTEEIKTGEKIMANKLHVFLEEAKKALTKTEK